MKTRQAIYATINEGGMPTSRAYFVSNNAGAMQLRNYRRHEADVDGNIISYVRVHIPSLSYLRGGYVESRLYFGMRHRNRKHCLLCHSPWDPQVLGPSSYTEEWRGRSCCCVYVQVSDKMSAVHLRGGRSTPGLAGK